MEVGSSHFFSSLWLANGHVHLVRIHLHRFWHRTCYTFLTLFILALNCSLLFANFWSSGSLFQGSLTAKEYFRGSVRANLCVSLYSPSVCLVVGLTFTSVISKICPSWPPTPMAMATNTEQCCGSETGMFSGLPDPDLLVRGPDPALNPSIIKQK